MLTRLSSLKFSAFACSFLLLSLSLLAITCKTSAQPELPKSAISFNSLALAESKIHYAYAGNQSKPGVIFIHGTPGGWSAFEDYLNNQELQKQFFMISVDRLGWGDSKVKDGGVVSDFVEQAAAIVKVMQLQPDKQWIIVGHSLGASLAPQLAMLAPNHTRALILLAGSLDPKLGQPRWFNRVANNWLLGKIIGKKMRNSNNEIMQLGKQLEFMNDALSEQALDTKLIIIQGGKDRLVSPKNAPYAVLNWQTSFTSIDLIELPKEGHFLPWRQAPLVMRTIQKLALDSHPDK